MMQWLLFVLGLVIFVGLVVIHELGHYLVARRNNIEVEEFGLGFPPRAKIITKKKGTTYTLNWLPLGGFVKLKGEHDADRQKGSFGAASLWAKVKVMLAGVGMNLLAAFVLLTLLALVGMPQLIDNQFTVKGDTKVTRDQVLVAEVEPGSPADKAGLKPGDQLLSLDAFNLTPVDITSQSQLPTLTKEFSGLTTQIKIKRNGRIDYATANLRHANEVSSTHGYLGISPTEYVLQKSTWSAPVVAVGLIGQFTAVTFRGIGTVFANLFHGHAKQAADVVTGPVGIIVLLKDGSKLGYQFVLLLMAVISLTLAIMNALPIPALDGGRLFLILTHRLFKKVLTPEREELINGIGFIALMVLVAIVTLVDLTRKH